MDSITIHAPAKVNLFLKVLDRRPDGYHTVETLFEKIAIFDKIRLRKAPSGISISSDYMNLPLGRGNIAYRAVELLEDRCKMSLGVKIEIDKTIPIGSGLGGGSSDAAAALVGVNRLYDLGIEDKELESLGRVLGADVPFFVLNETWALGRDRGDALSGIDARMKLWHIVIIPPLSIFSKDAYEWIDTVERRESPGIDNTLRALQRNDISSLGENLYNDLEDLSFQRMTLLRSLKDILVDSGARGALISGSGPALFGIFEEKREVMDSKRRIEERIATCSESCKIFITPTLSN